MIYTEVFGDVALGNSRLVDRFPTALGVVYHIRAFYTYADHQATCLLGSGNRTPLDDGAHEFAARHEFATTHHVIAVTSAPPVTAGVERTASTW